MRDWERVSIKEVAPAIQPDFPDPEQIVWELSLDEIESQSGKILAESRKLASTLGSSKVAFDERNVLYMKLRPYLNKVALPDKFGVGSSELIPLRPNADILDRRYLWYYLRSPQFVHFANTRTSGANLPRVSMRAFWKHEIPLPPLPVQRRIAAVLDKADALRRKRRQALDKLDDLLQAVFLDMFGDPVTNPKGWTKSPLQKASSQIVDCPHSTPAWQDDGIICLRTSNLGKGEWDWTDTRYVSEADYTERTKRSEIAPGDIILSREGTIGIAAIVENGMKICMGQRLVQVRPHSDRVTSEYLLYLLLRELDPERIEHVMYGSTSKHLNVKQLRDLSIPIPPLRLQKTFSSRVNAIKEIKASMERESFLLDNLFNALMQKAFKGELMFAEEAVESFVEVPDQLTLFTS